MNYIEFQKFSTVKHSTVSTYEAVYLIGGYIYGGYSSSNISRFSNNVWSHAGDLVHARYQAGAITHGSQTMVIGGCAKRTNIDISTEIWNLDQGDFKLIEPTLPYCSHYHQVGIWLVEPDFCSKK